MSHIVLNNITLILVLSFSEGVTKSVIIQAFLQNYIISFSFPFNLLIFRFIMLNIKARGTLSFHSKLILFKMDLEVNFSEFVSHNDVKNMIKHKSFL